MATKRKTKKPDAPPKIYNRHMQSAEVSVLYVYSKWRGMVGEHDVRKLEADGYVRDGKITDAGRKRLEQLGEVGEGYDGFGKSGAHTLKPDD
jgi:hypothetical protein